MKDSRQAGMVDKNGKPIFRYRLITLFTGTTVIAVTLGVLSLQVLVRQRMVHKIQSFGPEVIFTESSSYSGNLISWMFGKESGSEITTINFGPWRWDDQNDTLGRSRNLISSVDIHSCLTCKLQSLRELNLVGTQVSDETILILSAFANLEVLRLSQTEVSDESVLGISSCKKLKYLSIAETRITKAGVEKLQAALPGCHIKTTENMAVKGASMAGQIDYSIGHDPVGMSLIGDTIQDVPPPPK